ncbi:MAG: response regulator transcription factor [Bdellovibrionales bacterium]|nr:response regulator transcription factor [Bdellovibrionales bacterium]
MESKIKLLIVEDEEPIRQGLVDVFTFHGYEVDAVDNGTDGLERAESGAFDLIVLDVMLPGMDGFSICNAIRSKSRDQLVIMLTAKTSEEDIITGLKLGADDYVAKPFSVQELVLRVQAVLRRSKKLETRDSELIVGNGIKIDTRNLIGTDSAGSEIPFTRREVDLLSYLWANRERPVTRDELLAEVWGYKRGAHIETRTVDIHIAKLRRKIEDNPKEPSYLVTIRGEGYKLLPPVGDQ